MTGLVNSTGARSGVIGTTVGTPIQALGFISATFLTNSSTSSDSTGNYTKPAGCTKILVIATGGGGAGAGAGSGQTGGGGGAGSTTIGYITNSSSSYFNGITAGSGTIAYSIGKGGAGVAGSAGTDGSDTWFGTDSVNFLLKGVGGGGGLTNGGASTFVNGSVGASAYATADYMLLAGAQGTSEMGDGGSALKTGGKGGASYWGDGGPGAVENSNTANNAQTWGTGGGGASGANGSGAGMGGAIVIYAYG